MKINYARQVKLEELLIQSTSILICSSGFESRSTHFAGQYTGKVDLKKICLSFSEREVHSKKDNDNYFKSQGFQIIKLADGSLNEILDIYKKLFSDIELDEFSIVVDYSCMTKIMYAGLVKYFASLEGRFTSVTIHFSYTIPLYTEPEKSRSNLHNAPIPLFPTVEHTDSKVAVIANLGYESGKADGLMEYLQPDSSDVYLFFTSEKTNPSYYRDIKTNNSYILKKVPKNNHFEFELQNITQVFNLLEPLINYLISRSYRIIVVPLGPKVFSLVSILLTLKYNDLTILRVSDGITGNPIDKKPDESKDFPIVSVKLIDD